MRDARWEKRLALLALATMAWFAASAVAVQAMRGEYDWRQAPLSFYLAGPHSAWLVAAYYLLGVGLAALALGLRRHLAAAARYALSPALFIGGGVALAVTATWPGGSPGHPVDALAATVHGLAATSCFLWVGFGMLLQSLGLRRDARWRGSAGPLLALATVAFIALWCQVLWKALPRGASQKAVVALYLAWAGVAAWRLYRLGGVVTPPLPAAPAGDVVPEHAQAHAVGRCRR